jgi:protocatechuate 4,5-dioxygenase alpha chain
MAWKTHDHDRIPGTYVFDGRRSAMGYPLNKMCMSFNDEANREEFKRDEIAYCRKYGLSEAQTEALLQRDWLKLVQLGGNIYYLAKLGIAGGGGTVQTMSAQMTGMSVDEFKAKLLAYRESAHG